MRKAAIILPTYNEVNTIEKLISQIFEISKNNSKWEIHVVGVDSNSPDNTAESVKKILPKYKNLHLLETGKDGLGKAYIEGFKYSIEKIKPYVLFEMDADFSHNPEKIPEFLEKIEQGADLVIGSRYIKGGSIPKDWAFHRKLFSITANIFVRLGFMKLSITDWTSGFRAIKTWVINSELSKLHSYTGYVFQVALLDNALKSNAIVKEVPINFIDRREGQSKINSFQYILHTFLYVFTKSSFIKFCIVGGVGFIVDFTISYFFIDVFHRPVWMSTIISAESAIISNFMFNNFWSFAHKKVSQNFAWSFIKFNSISLGSIIIQTIGMTICTSIFGKDLWPLYKALIIIFAIIPYSYVFYNKFVWKTK